MKKPIIAAILTSFLLAGGARGQMARVLKEQFHNEKELGIVLVTDKEVSKIDAALKDPTTHIIALQNSPKTVTPQMAKALLDWVRSGKSLWFYDARLGPYFGFKPYLMEASQFPHKPEDGEINGEKVDGFATVGIVIQENTEVVSGVGQCSVFLPPLEKDHYGSVEVEGDTIPLLRFNPTSPAIAALRWDGRGIVVFKPLVWPEAFSGDRFQANLLDFSGGFQIPGPGGSDKIGNPPGPKHAYVEGKPAVPLETTAVVAAASPPPSASPKATPAPDARRALDDKLVGPDGEVKGAVMNETFRFETGSKSLTLKRSEIKSLVMGGTMDLDTLVTWDGSTQHGILLDQKIEFDLGTETKTYKKHDVSRVDLAREKQP